MILPSKHLKLAESYLGLGSFILAHLEKPKSLDSLWSEFGKVNNSDKFPAYHTFDSFILTVDFLFTIGLVSQSDKGMLARATD